MTSPSRRSPPTLSMTPPARTPQGAQRLDKGTPPSSRSGPSKALTVNIPEAMHRKLKGSAGEQGTTIQKIVVDLLENAGYG